MAFNEKFTVTSAYIPKSSKRRSGLMINKVRFIVAHDTGNKNSTAAQNVNYYISSKDEQSTSVHLFVDDKQMIECIPALNALPEKAWHVLYNVPKDNELYGVNANDGAIGVEYCYGENIDAGKAYEKYVWVLAKLCFVYGLDPSKDVVGHFLLDPKRRLDPLAGLAYSRHTYDQLLKDIVSEYNSCTGAGPAASFTITSQQGYMVTTVKMNLRSAPNTKASVVQVLPAYTSLQYTEIISDGEPVNNNPVWYKDANGNFFWSGAVQPPTALPNLSISTNSNDMVPDTICFDFIKQREGLNLKAYQDSAGVWTIGYGTIIYEDGSPVKEGDTITQARAEDLLKEEILKKSVAVNKAVYPVVLNQHQYDALVSFTYNVGAGALLGSTLLKRIKENPQQTDIRDAFMMWDKIYKDGQLIESPGLKERRKAEADLYFS